MTLMQWQHAHVLIAGRVGTPNRDQSPQNSSHRASCRCQCRMERRRGPRRARCRRPTRTSSTATCGTAEVTCARTSESDPHRMSVNSEAHLIAGCGKIETEYQAENLQQHLDRTFMRSIYSQYSCQDLQTHRRAGPSGAYCDRHGQRRPGPGTRGGAVPPPGPRALLARPLARRWRRPRRGTCPVHRICCLHSATCHMLHVY